jgi:hypothetical protein
VELVVRRELTRGLLMEVRETARVTKATAAEEAECRAGKDLGSMLRVADLVTKAVTARESSA